MESTDFCKRRAHREPGVVFTFKNKDGNVQAWKTEDASIVGARSAEKPPEGFIDASDLKMKIDGADMSVGGQTLGQCRYKGQNQWLAKYAIVNPQEGWKEHIWGIRTTLRKAHEEIVSDISAKKEPRIPRNKMRLGILMAMAVVCITTVIYPVSQLLFANVKPIISFGSTLGLIAIFALLFCAVAIPWKKGKEWFDESRVYMLIGLGLAAYFLAWPPLMSNLFFTANAPTTTTLDIWHTAIIGGGLLFMIIGSFLLSRMQKGLDEYAKNDTRVAYLNYLNQTLLAMSMAEESGMSLKTALEGIHKAGDQYINCTYR